MLAACNNLSENDKALFLACQNGNASEAIKLIGLSANSNARDGNNLSPLYYAARQGYFIIVEALIKHGAEINASCANGMTPLHAVASVRKMIDHSTIPREKHTLWRNQQDVINTMNLLLSSGEMYMLCLLMVESP